MPINIDDIWIYRMTHYQNLETILQNGMLAKNKVPTGMGYVPIGNPDIISRRSSITVSCYPELVLDDFVPFYFAIRTPMLYQIHSGYRDTIRIDQKNIIYICCKVSDILAYNLTWCFTNGNSAIATTRFTINLNSLNRLDWGVIQSNNFRNDEVDNHRTDKKQAEFLVKDMVPADLIRKIVVSDHHLANRIKSKISSFALAIEVEVSTPTENRYYLSV